MIDDTQHAMPWERARPRKLNDSIRHKAI